MVIRPHINLNVVDMLADDIVKATKWLDEFGGNAKPPALHAKEKTTPAKC